MEQNYRQRMHTALDKLLDSRREKSRDGGPGSGPQSGGGGESEESLRNEVEKLRKEFNAVTEAATKRGASDYTPEERKVKEKFKEAESRLSEFRKSKFAGTPLKRSTGHAPPGGGWAGGKWIKGGNKMP